MIERLILQKLVVFPLFAKNMHKSKGYVLNCEEFKDIE
jgi:hypothetical protein